MPTKKNQPKMALRVSIHGKVTDHDIQQLRTSNGEKKVQAPMLKVRKPMVIQQTLKNASKCRGHLALKGHQLVLCIFSGVINS